VSSMQISTTPSTVAVDDARLAEILADPGFGTHFTDHMFTVEWTPEKGWHDARITPYGPITLDPATAVLHYAQETFEGMKAYRREDGSVWTFRPEANAARMARSSDRLALPVLPIEDFVEAVDALVKVDERWVPDAAGEKSLYIRPFMFASEKFLGVRPSQHVTFMVIASPAGAYFKGGLKPVSLWLTTEYTRAGRGGMGAAKTGGNYASSLVAQQEAYANGCDQVVFLDAQEGKYVEELGGMNMYFVYADGRVVTPEIGTILEGITRASIIELAGKLGHPVEERKISIDEWREGVASGDIVEIFACGTAAVVTPVGSLRWDGGETPAPTTEAGPLTSKIRQALVDVQFGRADDTFGWMHRVV
jgi:branched-chain amino acid aminotransferase